jgi:hypothetical protein
LNVNVTQNKYVFDVLLASVYELKRSAKYVLEVIYLNTAGKER